MAFCRLWMLLRKPMLPPNALEEVVSQTEDRQAQLSLPDRLSLIFKTIDGVPEIPRIIKLPNWDQPFLFSALSLQYSIPKRGLKGQCNLVAMTTAWRRPSSSRLDRRSSGRTGPGHRKNPPSGSDVPGASRSAEPGRAFADTWCVQEGSGCWIE